MNFLRSGFKTYLNFQPFKCNISRFDNAHGNTVQSLYNTVFGVQQNGQFLREPYGPRREKTCLRGVTQGEVQTSLLSYRD